MVLGLPMAMLLLAPSVAAATPSLEPAADVAEPGLRTWWRPGELVVGVPGRSDRSALRPLVDPTPTALPSDLSSWTELGTSCTEAPEARLTSGSHTLTAVVHAPGAQRIVQLKVGDKVIAQQTLGRPVTPCALHLGQADALPGLELMVAWVTADESVRGLTVFRVPEAAVTPAE